MNRFLALLILFYFITKITINNYFSTNDKERRLVAAAFFSIILAFIIVSIYGTPNGWMFWLFSAIIINIPKLSIKEAIDEENKIIEESITMINIKNIFRGSIFNKILKTRKDNIILDILRNSKIISLFGNAWGIIKNSRTYKIIERIID